MQLQCQLLVIKLIPYFEGIWRSGNYYIKLCHASTNTQASGHERKDMGHVYVYDIIVKYLLISSSFVAASVSVTLLCFIYKIFYLLLM